MNRMFSLLCVASLGMLLQAAGLAPAGPVTFTYDFTPTAPTIQGDAGKNWLDLTSQAPITVTASSSDIVASNLTVHNNLSDTFVGTGSGVAYTVKLQLTDGAATTTRTYGGHLTEDSFIKNGNPNLINVLDTPGVDAFTLNGHSYTVQMTAFVSPSPWNADPDNVTKGAIGFHITADNGDGNGPGPNDTPEPSTLMLSCIGLAGLGWRTWRRCAAQA